LAEDGDETRIAAELLDVVAHPLERSDDVQHSGAAGKRKVGFRPLSDVRVSEHVQPMVDRDDHDVVGEREPCAIDDAARTGAA